MNALPPPPPPPGYVYPEWPPAEAKRRHFIWWEALLGLVAPAGVGWLSYEAFGFSNAVSIVILATGACVIAAGVRRHFTLMVAAPVGVVLLALGLIAVVLFSLFTAAVV